MKKILSLTILALLASSIAAAQPPGSDKWNSGGMTPEQAAKQAQSRHGGRVLNVRPAPKGKNGTPGYRVKLLDKGEVRTVTVPQGKGKKDKKRARPDR